ncbi:MAG: hypothetical protein ACNA7J_08025 [Wenzhouxiangella sp.]
MRQSLILPSLFAVTVILSGCGPETETAAPPEPAETTETRVADERPEPVVDTPLAPPSEPAERGDPRIDEDDEVHWWDDEELAETLGVEPEQRTRLLEARRQLNEARVEGRARLEQQHVLQEQAEGDADRLAELREQAGLISQELEDAEARWQQTVRTTLRPEQYRHIEHLMDEDLTER